ncbi:hypothetical protein ACWDG9_16940 [Streptomyces sp. NPDC001073]
MTAHRSCLRIDAQTLPPHTRNEAEHRITEIETLTEQLTGTVFQDEPATAELATHHQKFAALVGLMPEHPDEQPVAFRCDCGAYRLVSSATRTRDVWNDDAETTDPSPVCDCPLNTVETLSPRTELFLTAIYAEAAALTAEDADRQAEFAELADDAMWTARYCDPGSPQPALTPPDEGAKWDRSHLTVRFILEDFAKRAAATGLPSYDKGSTRTLLLDAATTAVHTMSHGRPLAIASVSFPATRRGQWSRTSGVITTFTDGTQRSDLKYPSHALDAVLGELTALRQPRPGSRLTATLTSPRR